MGAQPVELLADIGAADQHRQFLRDPVLGHCRRETGQFGEQCFEAGAAPAPPCAGAPGPPRAAGAAAAAAPARAPGEAAAGLPAPPPAPRAAPPPPTAPP